MRTTLQNKLFSENIVLVITLLWATIVGMSYFYAPAKSLQIMYVGIGILFFSIFLKSALNAYRTQQLGKMFFNIFLVFLNAFVVLYIQFALFKKNLSESDSIFKAVFTDITFIDIVKSIPETLLMMLGIN